MASDGIASGARTMVLATIGVVEGILKGEERVASSEKGGGGKRIANSNKEIKKGLCRSSSLEENTTRRPQ